MKIIEGNQSLTKSQPRLVEVGRKILMNGSVYESSDFSPLAYNWCEVESNQKLGDKIAYVQDYILSGSARSTDAPGLAYISESLYSNTGAYDKMDDSIFYKCIEGGGDSEHDVLIHKFKVENKKLVLLKSAPTGYNNVQIVGQNEGNIYCLAYKRENDSNDSNNAPLSSYALSIDKKTLTVNVILTGKSSKTNRSSGGVIKLLKETSSYVIAIQSVITLDERDNYANVGDVAVIRIDKVNNTAVRIFKGDVSNKDVEYTVPVSNDISNFLKKDEFRDMFYSCVFKKSIGKVGVRYGILNTSDVFVGTPDVYESVEDVDIDWNGASEDIVSKFTTPRKYLRMYSCHSVRYKTIINKCNDKSYLTILCYNSNNSKTNIDEEVKDFYSTYAFTFTINAFGSLRFESYTDLPKYIHAILMLDDEGKRMYAVDDHNLYYIEFNEGSKKLEVISTNNIVPRSVGVDMAGRTWVMSANKDVHMFNEHVSSKVSLSFKDAAYDYIGQDIETSINVNCINIFGVKIATDMELEIRGNAYFKFSGGKKVRVTTLPLTDTKVDIIINGPGQLSIIPKVIL